MFLALTILMPRVEGRVGYLFHAFIDGACHRNSITQNEVYIHFFLEGSSLYWVVVRVTQISSCLSNGVCGGIHDIVQEFTPTSIQA